MAAPFRQSFKTLLSITKLSDKSLIGGSISNGFQNSFIRTERHFSVKNYLKSFSGSRNAGVKTNASLAVGFGVGGSALALLHISAKCYSHFHPVLAESSLRPNFKVSREVRNDVGNSDLKMTLYQFQTCPFCCKVRAILDYHGFSYDVIEVNSVTKKQIKWSDYKKVPILVVEKPGCDEVILRDSTVIISILESYLHDRSTSLDKLNSFFPSLEENIGGKKKVDFPNKYFVMFQEKADLGTTAKEREEERKWRKWADDNMVHMLSPNVYRTRSEALQAFRYFSDVGEWEKNFSTFERHTVIYVGAAVMYVMGKILKNKYRLKEDVRQSLYDSCNEWTRAMGNGRKFMGGDQPNMADLAVYGVLNSIEGCTAFQEALDNTKIGPWYSRTKEAIANHQGAHPLNSKTTPSDTPKETKKKRWGIL